MSPSMSPTPVQHKPEAGTFELIVDGHRSEVVYKMHGRSMHLVHTEVPSALEGQGIAGRLVKAALDHARAQGFKVKPECTYVQAYMRRHPETLDLLEA